MVPIALEIKCRLRINMRPLNDRLHFKYSRCVCVPIFRTNHWRPIHHSPQSSQKKQNTSLSKAIKQASKAAAFLLRTSNAIIIVQKCPVHWKQVQKPQGKVKDLHLPSLLACVYLPYRDNIALAHCLLSHLRALALYGHVGGRRLKPQWCLACTQSAEAYVLPTPTCHKGKESL